MVKILTLLLNELEKARKSRVFEGLCDLTTTLYNNGKITQNEKDTTVHYIKENRGPTSTSNTGYFWPKGDFDIRKEWLIDRILVETGEKKETPRPTLEQDLQKALMKAGIDTDSGGFHDGSASWVGIIKTTDKHRITVNILFKPDGTIDDVNVYKAEIRTIIDTENEVKLT